MCWPREVQSSIRVAKESWGLLSSDCRANRPHLGLCPEASVPLQGRQGSRGCIPDTPGETGIHLEWKQRTPLCSRVATGISWSSLGGLKGVKPPEAFGERSRDWSLGHTGDEGPQVAMTGEARGCSRAAAPVCGFSRGTTARSVSLSWGGKEVGSRGQIPLPWLGSNDALPLATRMETRLPWRPTRGSLTSPSHLVRNRTLGPPLENHPETPPSSRR